MLWPRILQTRVRNATLNKKFIITRCKVKEFKCDWNILKYLDQKDKDGQAVKDEVIDVDGLVKEEPQFGEADSKAANYEISGEQSVEPRHV
jgi:hypothetical protein